MDRKIDTVIFDLDGVIIDTERLWDDANRMFLAGHQATYDRAAIKPLIAGKSLADGTRIMQEALGFAGELDDLVAERVVLVEQQLRNGLSFMPGFLQFHEAIKSGYKSCVATSMDPRLLAIVDERLDLTGLFGGNLFSISDVGYLSKPDPAIFLYAARRVGAIPERCVVIEDAPKGVQAAKNAGMYCIALAATFDETLLSAADRIVRSFAEIDLSRL